MSKKRPSSYAMVTTTKAGAETARSARARGNRKPGATLRRQRRVVAYGVAAALVLGGTITLAVVGHSSSSGYRTTAANWSLPSLGTGPTVTLTSLEGRPTVVNFFASWCQVCASELPVFARDATALRGKVNVVEVNALETGNGVAFATRYNLFRDVTAVLRDVGGAQGDGLFQSLGGSTSLPMTAFYTASGHLISDHIGGYDATSLATELKALYGVTAPL